MHACCVAASLRVALMDYGAAGWSGLKSQGALSLLGKRPAVVAVTVMAPSAEWMQVKQHNSFSDLEKAPQGEGKPS